MQSLKKFAKISLSLNKMKKRKTRMLSWIRRKSICMVKYLLKGCTPLCCNTDLISETPRIYILKYIDKKQFHDFRFGHTLFEK